MAYPFLFDVIRKIVKQNCNARCLLRVNTRPLKTIAVIGSGFSSLTAAATLAREGANVFILEKNSQPGGRARQFTADGFTFDMGPSWYWMPEVFERFFNTMGRTAGDFYALKRLDPSYRILYRDEEMHVPADLDALYALFEAREPGSAAKLKRFLEEAGYKYRVGMEEFVWKPSYSVREFLDWRIVKSAFRLQMFSSVSKQVRRLFKDEKLIELLEFPVLFLGATPQNTPALYSLMNYADLVLGTWYPMGGMYEVVRALVQVAEEAGVRFHYDEEVRQIETRDGRAVAVVTDKGRYEVDVVVSGADYHHTEQVLLDAADRTYTEAYWDSRVMAPSSLLFYLGVEGKVPGLEHHNLFFDADFHAHAIDIYEKPKWPEEPLFYVCAPSVTDPSVAPEGMENLFMLIPLAPDLEDTEAMRDKYYDIVMERLERRTGFPVRERVVYKRGYAHRDFVADYHAYKGNAYGLSNTLMQTAFLKPKMRHRKVSNLFYTGQLTTPGPGMPPAIISGQVVAGEVKKLFLRQKP
jgi:phytoene desaturase